MPFVNFYQTDIDVPIDIDGQISSEINNLIYKKVDIQKEFNLNGQKFDFIYMRNGTCICFPEEPGETCASLGPAMDEYIYFFSKIEKTLNLKNKKSFSLIIHKNWGNPNTPKYYKNLFFWNFLAKEAEFLNKDITITVLTHNQRYAGFLIQLKK